MAWRLAKSLETLRAQVNAAHPSRKKTSDGTIGDAAHAARKSDHNPNSAGVVQALDITHDPANGFDAGKFADALLASHDERIKYVISNARIGYSSDWKWKPYSGANAHRAHVHVSVKDSAVLYDDARPWGAVGPQAQPNPVSVPTGGRQMGITATVFGGADDPNQSAYGGMVDPAKPGVALPYRFKGTRPKVRVFKGGKSVVCDIVDVGPWNIDDPYWEKIGHRPQAETGTDKYKGRKTNLAGIDLTPAAANAVGLNGKGVVDWEFVGTSAPVPTRPSPMARDNGIIAGIFGAGGLMAAYAPDVLIPVVIITIMAVVGYIGWRIYEDNV